MHLYLFYLDTKHKISPSKANQLFICGSIFALVFQCSIFSSHSLYDEAVVSHTYRVEGFLALEWNTTFFSLGAYVGAACIASPVPLQKRSKGRQDRYMLTHTHTRDRQTDRDGKASWSNDLWNVNTHSCRR